ncbi:MAG TPA: glycosyltransferase family 4 protein [Acidimicrobiia bacterium]
MSNGRAAAPLTPSTLTPPMPAERARPRLVHLTTTDISLALLLGPQLRAFQNAGFEVIGVSAPGPFVETIERDGIRHVALQHSTRSMQPREDAAALVELISLFRRLQPSIVHTHNPKPGVYGRLAARAAGVPVIVNTVHGLYALPEDALTKRAVVYGLERVAASVSHAELLQNVEDVAVLRRLHVPDAKVSVLGNGIDLARFDPERVDAGRVAVLRKEMGAPDEADSEAVIVGLVGRLVWEKGYREVLDAARRLSTEAPQVRFVIVGGREDAKADALSPDDIASAERLGNVVFLGHRDDVEDLYPAFDIFALASYREGFPRTPMEASALGLPIIATDIRGCRQVVDDGITGRLVAPRSSGALATAILELASDPQRRRAMGAAARAKAIAEFDQQRVIDHTLATYERLLARRAPRPASRG